MPQITCSVRVAYHLLRSRREVTLASDRLYRPHRHRRSGSRRGQGVLRRAHVHPWAQRVVRDQPGRTIQLRARRRSGRTAVLLPSRRTGHLLTPPNGAFITSHSWSRAARSFERHTSGLVQATPSSWTNPASSRSTGRTVLPPTGLILTASSSRRFATVPKRASRV